MAQNTKIMNLLQKLDSGVAITVKDQAMLDECSELYLDYRKHDRIPHSIGKLKNLKILSLSGLGLTSLPDEICQLDALHELNLQDNKLTHLPVEFARLKQLKHLDLSSNPWGQFPEQICSFKNLLSLNLSECDFDSIPEQILDLKMNFEFRKKGYGIILENTTCKSPDIAVFQQSWDSIFTYYQRLREEGKIVRETKVIFLGDGNVGKTYTIDRIRNNGKKLPGSHHTDQTKGISIVHQDFQVENSETHKKSPLTIHFWDFGGQEIMHSMHRCFLTNNTIYVIVLSGRAEDMGRRLDYWMTSLNSFTNGKCPVIVLENCFDVQNIHGVNTEGARRRYEDNIEDILSINVKEASDGDFKHLTDTITSLAVTKSHYGASVAALRADVKSKIEQMNEAVILESDFHKIFPADVSPKERRDILEWLTDLGVSYCYAKEENQIMLRGYVILNPEWATNAIYAIITSGSALQANSPRSVQNGILTIRDISDILENTKFVNNNITIDRPYGTHEIVYILELMRRFHIAFQIPTRNDVFIPALCTKSEPSGISAEMKNPTIHFELRYEYLPSNILHRLMTSQFEELERGGKWWYSGAVFDSKDYGCKALVLQETRKGLDVISIYIHQYQEGEAWRYLLKIRELLEDNNQDIHTSENYLIYTPEGDQRSEEIKLSTIQKHQQNKWLTYRSDVFDREIPLTEILKNIVSPGMEEAAVGNNLLDVIIAGCKYLQKRKWVKPDENIRNDYMTDLLRSAQILLRSAQFYVLDQTRSGRSTTDSGELDFLIQGHDLRDIAIIEALNLSSIDSDYLQKHITKLMSDKKYNVNGLRDLYLLVYADTDNFLTNGKRKGFVERYEAFIREKAVYPEEMQELVSVPQDVNNIAVWTAKHANDVTVHHICAKFA